MALDEVGPGVRRAIRAGFDAMLFQDIPHSLAADLLDSQLAKLSDNSGQN